jgi:hypothetical protein
MGRKGPEQWREPAGTILSIVILGFDPRMTVVGE